MKNRFRDGHRTIASLYLPLRRKRLRFAPSLASRAGCRFLKLLRMSVGEFLIDGSAQHSSNFMTEFLDLRESRILGRPVRSVTHCSQCCHTLIKFLLCLVIQNNCLSFLAHDSFSASCTKYPKLKTNYSKHCQNLESKSAPTKMANKLVPAPADARYLEWISIGRRRFL